MSIIDDVGDDSLPAASVAVAVIVSQSDCDVVKVIVYMPVLSAVAVPITLPLASFTVTVLPASAVPVTVVPDATTVGDVGAVASTVALVAADTLPAESVAVTVIEDPSV